MSFSKPAAVQMAVVAGAFLAGVLLDRLVFSAGAAPRKEDNAAGAQASTQTTLVSDNAAAAAPPSSRTRAAAGAATAPSASAAPGALDSILTQRDQRQRLRELQDFIQAIPPNGYADALKRIRQITSTNERELASRLLIAQWVQTDPDGALQFAAGNRGFEYVAEDVFHHFAAADMNGAMERAKGMPGNDLRYRALRGILSFKADTDPRAAIELAATLGEFRGNEPLTSVVYRQWAANDPQAAAFAAAEDSQGEGWRSPVGSVVQTWTEQDPVAAANWSLSIADAQTQARSLAQVMRSWSRNDPTAAANWIHGLESGASRDAAVAGLAQSLVNSDAQTAVSWVGTISDDGMRMRTLERLSGPVMWRDPQNGAALLQAAGLPADKIRDYRRRRDQ